MTTASIAAVITSAHSPCRQAIRISGTDLQEQSLNILGFKPSFKYSAENFSLNLPYQGETIEIALLVFSFPMDRSYTGESVIELHFDPGPALANALLDHLYRKGICPASPGEFTRRAFLNGRVSLDQARAVAALITAGDEEERQQALRSLGGSEAPGLRQLKDRLFHLRRCLEATVDFPDETDVQSLTQQWSTLLHELEDLLRRMQFIEQRRQDRQPFHVLLLGPVNAGKSSLVRALLPHEQPIVTALAGTTLDLVPYSINLAQRRAVLYDSPGLMSPTRDLDKASLQHLHTRLESFDAYVLLQPADQAPVQWPTLPPRRPTLHLLSKMDLGSSTPPPHELAISALQGYGLSELKAWLDQHATEGSKIHRSPWTALEARLAGLCREKLPILRELLLSQSACEELAAYELDQLLEEVDDTLYEDSGSEALLDSIFRDFCIGK